MGTKTPFLVWMDHENLEYLRTAKRPNSWKARWYLFFLHLNFSLSYQPGSKNTKPDALFRQFSPAHDTVPDTTILKPQSLVGSALLDNDRLDVSPSPPEVPPGKLFVPEAEWPHMLEWEHRFRLVCHPGGPDGFAAHHKGRHMLLG